MKKRMHTKLRMEGIWCCRTWWGKVPTVTNTATFNIWGIDTEC